MKKTACANLFAEARNWPYIPPWILLSSPQVAALLGVTPETLHAWKTLGSGPEAVSTALIQPTRGNPSYYRLAQVRKWASERIGMSYTIQDQITDFLMDHETIDIVSSFPLDVQVNVFDDRLESDLQDIRKGKQPIHFDYLQLLDWDEYISKQPRFEPNKSKYFDLSFALLQEMPRKHIHCLTPRQLEYKQSLVSEPS